MFHSMRTFKKHVKQVKLVGTVPGKDRDLFRNKLATTTRHRVYLELVRIRKNFPLEKMFLEKASAAIKNIIPCFFNDHRNCRKFSMVCTAPTHQNVCRMVNI